MEAAEGLLSPMPPSGGHRYCCQFDLLTAREREVLRWVMEGFCNRDIAKVLVVSAETVKTHSGSCLRKLGPANAPRT